MLCCLMPIEADADMTIGWLSIEGEHREGIVFSKCVHS